MNSAHAHLMLNNVPGLGIMGGLLLLLLGAWWRSDAVHRAALVVFALAGAITLAAFLTGREAVLVAGNVPGVSLPHIGDHEASAPAALAAGLVLAVVAGAGSVIYRGERPVPRLYVQGVTLVALVALVLVMRTAYLGGHVHHPETMWNYVDPSTQGR